MLDLLHKAYITVGRWSHLSILDIGKSLDVTEIPVYIVLINNLC